uniref:NADH-ubiquinone oxidoreductase chain 3 n=1 Tax=Hyalopeplus sp. TaxID=2931294 RepID=A0A8T9ZZM7_9HEMI|nr:NADH dehydrogenase subunit 3 [Hyalopeplus sp.]
MMKIMTSIIMMIMLSMIMMMLCSVISKKSINMREKMSPFECGFDPKSSSRMPFSSQFFLIAVLFLIFDIEIVIILPMINCIKMSKMTSWFMASISFLVVLLLGLYHEWNNGVLEWTN